MTKAIPFGAQSTADNVLAGIDLTGRHVVVTGCASGLGFETMNALSANGAHVFGLARSLSDATAACRRAGPFTTPIGCDLSDLDSIAAAAETILARDVALDAIVANAAVANPPRLGVKYGMEMQFLVNHIGHFALIDSLLPRVRDRTGRIVVVSGSASINHAPPEGIMFDNLDGSRFYKPLTFYGQSKLANALYAKELSRRLVPRGIAVNSLHPGATRGTRIHKSSGLAAKIALSAAQVFMRSAAHGAATQALLAGSPLVEGVSGEYWANCRIARGNPLLEDGALARRLWAESEQILERHHGGLEKSLRQAA